MGRDHGSAERAVGVYKLYCTRPRISHHLENGSVAGLPNATGSLGIKTSLDSRTKGSFFPTVLFLTTSEFDGPTGENATRSNWSDDSFQFITRIVVRYVSNMLRSRGQDNNVGGLFFSRTSDVI